MAGKMKKLGGAVGGFVSKPFKAAGRKIDGGLSAINSVGTTVLDHSISKGELNRASKHVALGSSVKSNTSANESLYGKLISKAKPNGVIDKLTANTGYRTVTENVSGELLDGMEEHISTMQKELSDVGIKIDAGGLDEKAMKTLTDQQASLQQRIGRANNLVDTGSYERSMTGAEYMRNYYNDETNGAYRRRATAIAGVGTAAAIGVGTRLGTGGDLTHRGDGKRDIMGVPFV